MKNGLMMGLKIKVYCSSMPSFATTKAFHSGEPMCHLLLLPFFVVAKGVFVVVNLFTAAKDSFTVANPMLVFISFCSSLQRAFSFVVADLFATANNSLRPGKPEAAVFLNLFAVVKHSFAVTNFFAMVRKLLLINNSLFT